MSRSAPGCLRVGAVSYLNAKPLLDGLDEPGAGVDLQLDVPSALLRGLVERRFDLALCPILDLYQSPVPLRMVPVGGIGCKGPTLTVRLFSRVPLKRLGSIAVDADSHTSVGLLRCLLERKLGRVPELVPETMHDAELARKVPGDHAAVLLIGDKVVTHEPPRTRFPHQMDLGEEWTQTRGLPFLFAGWLTPLARLPEGITERMEALRAENLRNLPALVRRHAGPLGWPQGLALKYLSEILSYDTGDRELEAVATYGRELGALGVVSDADRDLLSLPAAAAAAAAPASTAAAAGPASARSAPSPPAASPARP